MEKHAGQCVKKSLHRRLFKSKVPVLSKFQTVITHSQYFSSFKEQTLHIEPKVLKMHWCAWLWRTSWTTPAPLLLLNPRHSDPRRSLCKRHLGIQEGHTTQHSLRPGEKPGLHPAFASLVQSKDSKWTITNQLHWIPRSYYEPGAHPTKTSMVISMPLWISMQP